MTAAAPLALIVASAVAYHLAQKAAGAAASMWPVLAVAYGTGFVVAVGLAVATGDAALRLPARPERNAAVLLGLAAVGIEAGFFLVYKAGWPLASAGVITNVVVTVVLAGIGIVVFGEQLTATRGAGIAVALIAAWMIARG